MPNWQDALNALKGAATRVYAGRPEVLPPVGVMRTATPHGPAVDRALERVPAPERQELLQPGAIRMMPDEELSGSHGRVNPFIRRADINIERVPSEDDLAATLTHEGRHLRQMRERGKAGLAFDSIYDRAIGHGYEDAPTEAEGFSAESGVIKKPKVKLGPAAPRDEALVNEGWFYSPDLGMVPPKRKTTDAALGTLRSVLNERR